MRLDRTQTKTTLTNDDGCGRKVDMSKRKNRHRKPRSLPEPHGPTGQRFGIPVTEYTVGSWCPTPDGSGPAEAVAIQLMTNVPDASFFMRLKTPAAVDEMIAALRRHQKDVGPEYQPKG